VFCVLVPKIGRSRVKAGLPMKRTKLYVGIRILTTLFILGTTFPSLSLADTSHIEFKTDVTGGFYKYNPSTYGSEYPDAASQIKSKRLGVTLSSPSGSKITYKPKGAAFGVTKEISAKDGLEITDTLSVLGQLTDIEADKCKGDSSGAGADPSLVKIRELRQYCFGGSTDPEVLASANSPQGLGPTLLKAAEPMIDPLFIQACVKSNLDVLNALTKTGKLSPIYEDYYARLLKIGSIFTGKETKYPADYADYEPGAGKTIDNKAASGPKHDDWEKSYKPIFAARDAAIEQINKANASDLCRLSDVKPKEQQVAEAKKEEAAKKEETAKKEELAKNDEDKASTSGSGAEDKDPGTEPVAKNKRSRRDGLPPRRGRAAGPGNQSELEPTVAQTEPPKPKPTDDSDLLNKIDQIIASRMQAAQMQQQQPQQQQYDPYAYNYNPYDPYNQGQRPYDPSKDKDKDGHNEKTAATQPPPSSPSSGGGGSPPPSSSPTPMAQTQPQQPQQQPMMGGQDPTGGMNPYSMMPQNQQQQSNPLQDAMLANMYANNNKTSTAADAAAKLAETQMAAANTTALNNVNAKLDALADNRATAASMGPQYGPAGNMPTSGDTTIGQLLGGGARGLSAGSRLMSSRNAATAAGRSTNLAARGVGHPVPNFQGTGIVPMGPSNAPGVPANLRQLKTAGRI
jgi:hypothetical protein